MSSPTQDKRGAGRFDRRIQLLRPTTIINRVNEKHSGEPEVAFDNFPACRLDKVTADDQDVINNVSRSSLRTDWEIRFLPNMDIKTTWTLKDLFDNRVYKIIAPVQEVGRGQSLIIKTEFVE